MSRIVKTFLLKYLWKMVVSFPLTRIKIKYSEFYVKALKNCTVNIILLNNCILFGNYCITIKRRALFIIHSNDYHTGVNIASGGFNFIIVKILYIIFLFEIKAIWEKLDYLFLQIFFERIKIFINNILKELYHERKFA